MATNLQSVCLLLSLCLETVCNTLELLHLVSDEYHQKK